MKVCIIIPMYNEDNRFKANELLNFSSNNTIDFFLINDGSTDNTEQLITEIASKKDFIFSFSYPKNIGKAEAVRFGVLQALKNKTYTNIGYLDADFATPLNEIDNLIETSIKYKKGFVMGSRIKRLGANIKRFKTRHIFGRIIATIISEVILKIDVYDTQCGAKLIDRDLASNLFKNPFTTKWLFDVELIARLKKQYGTAYCENTIYELPLKNWEDKGQSKITFLDMLSIPFQLSKIYFQYK